MFKLNTQRRIWRDITVQVEGQDAESFRICYRLPKRSELDALQSDDAAWVSRYVVDWEGIAEEAAIPFTTEALAAAMDDLPFLRAVSDGFLEILKADYTVKNSPR